LRYWAREPVEFEVDPYAFEVFDGIYEQAGLYAWRETVGQIENWTEARRDLAVERAIWSMPVTHVDASACNQLALVDPEFEQWHFVPFTPAD
jgi:hypothetical protein